MSEETYVMTVPEAGWRYLKLKRDAAYRAAREGQIPTIKIGGAIRVPIRAMERMLEEASSSAGKASAK